MGSQCVWPAGWGGPLVLGVWLTLGGDVELRPRLASLQGKARRTR